MYDTTWRKIIVTDYKFRSIFIDAIQLNSCSISTATRSIIIIIIIIIITYIYYALSSSVMFSNTRMNLKREAVYD